MYAYLKKMLNYKTFGSGPPLVILHGLFGMLDNWQTLGKKWAEHFSVYLVDLRNHGKSPHFDGHSYPEMAEDLVKFMEDQWLHEAYVLGHSMGGKVAMQLAQEYPDLVEKLVVVDMAPWENPAGHDQIFQAMLSLNPGQANDRSAMEAHLARYISTAGTRLFLMKNLKRDPKGGYHWKMNLPVLHEQYHNILQATDASVYDGPTLFIRGAKSDYIAADGLAEIQTLFPQASLQTVADAGHWVHADQPMVLHQMVLDFLV